MLEKIVKNILKKFAHPIPYKNVLFKDVPDFRLLILSEKVIKYILNIINTSLYKTVIKTLYNKLVSLRI